MTTVDQRLLAWAQDKVVSVPATNGKKYKTAVKGAPAFIQGCGLAQAVAFWRSKGGEMDTMLEHLATAPDLTGLADRAATAGIEEYAFLTQRCQHALIYLKRMVDAYIEGEE